jgi:ubiquinone/menaquinone biosynthesis C-methylase UbiE
MKNDTLSSLVLSADVIEKEGIFVTKEIAQKTVWDELALENPTHAVISAKDEIDAAAKSQEQIADIMQYVSEDSVLLDCGAGYGRVAKYLLPKQPLGGYIGVDSAYQMLKLFQQRYRLSDEEQETPLLLLNADIHTLPLVTDSVDVALVSAVFLHNHKEVVCRAVTELARVAKPGGKVLVYSSFPRSATAMGAQGYLYQCLLNLLGKPYKNGPVRYYRGKEIQRLFKDFNEVELRPMGYSVLPKTLIFLPGFLEKMYRVGIANPVNKLLESITPARMKPLFAVHYDVIATR